MSPSIKSLLFVGSVLLLVPPRSAIGQIFREGIVKRISPLVAANFHDRGDGVLWEGRVAAKGSLYLRVYFSEIKSPPDARYTVVIRGANDKAIARYSAEQFARRNSFYSGVLFSDHVKIQVEGAGAISGLSFKIDRFVHQVDLVGRLTPQSIVPNWRSVADFRQGTATVRLGEAVSKLYIGDGYVCSGFLVSPIAVLTNFHCLQTSQTYTATAESSSPDCSDIEIQFDFDRQPSPDAAVRTPCLRVLGFNPTLDYALLEINPQRGSGGKSARGHLRFSAQPQFDRKEAMIIHHPGGLAKKVSLGCSAFAGSAPDLLEHDCSTIGGSSGAPVIGADGMVIGLHFAGAYDESMTIGEINRLMTEGKVFRNRAKPIHLIHEQLKDWIPVISR